MRLVFHCVGTKVEKEESLCYQKIEKRLKAAFNYSLYFHRYQLNEFIKFNLQ